MIGYIRTHRYISVLGLLFIVGLSWWGYRTFAAGDDEATYTLGTVTRGTIVSSISGSGQVSASNQLELKSKASGEITYLGVQDGQYVAAGALIARIDSADAQKAVRDAQANLESAQIALEKLKKPASALSVTQSQNALANAQDALSKLYADSATDVVNTFLDLPNIITNLQEIQIGTTACHNTQWNIDCYANAMSTYEARTTTYRNTAYDDYIAAKNAYEKAFDAYQSLGANPDNVTVEKALADAYTTVSLTSKAVKSTQAFVQLYEDTLDAYNRTPSTVADTALTTLNAAQGTVNTHLSKLLADTNNLKQYKQTIVEKQQSLGETTAGADTLDLRSTELSVTKARNTLADAQQALADYSVYAPFAGTISVVSAKKYDTVGSGGVVATLITAEKMAELSVNEVDAAKVAIGDTAVLTFDAIDDLSMTGKVAMVDSVGAVAQGVVSYTIKISLDSQDDRVKPGMSVNALIQTDIHEDVLTVPSSAVKTQGDKTHVLIFTPGAIVGNDTERVTTTVTPTQVPVSVGISDDTSSEIISGLDEGQQIIIRSTNTSATATQSAPSLFGGGMRAR